MMKNCRKTFWVMIVLVAVLMMGALLSGCSIIKEGITGEKKGAVEKTPQDEEYPDMPPAFPILGDWFGVYNGSEYLGFRFTADGKCELQPALYPSDMFGPRYFGDYRWGGDDGKEIFLDLYKGVPSEVDNTKGNVWEEWTDGGRDKASTALTMNFRVYGGNMKSVALKTDAAGIDTEGYSVVQSGTFLVISKEGYSGPFIFGSEPYDQTEGKTKKPVMPDTFIGEAERFYTTAELNVRCGPSTDYGTYGTVPLGTAADKIGEASGNEDWAFVLLDNGGGWMNTGYLSTSRPESG